MLKEVDPRKVFVVQGRNEKANKAIYDFLRSIDLRPLEWEEVVGLTGKASPPTMEVVETGFLNAQAAVVILSGDDQAKLGEQFIGGDDPESESKLQAQPRQNVLLEMGMAMGLNFDRTLLVEFGELRPISDTVGLNVVRILDTPQTRQKIASRLETAGCSVNRKGEDWLAAGDFDIMGTEPATDLASESDDHPREESNDLSFHADLLLLRITEAGEVPQAVAIKACGLSRAKGEYLIDQISERKYISAGLYDRSVRDYILSTTAEGRKYLVENDLI